MLDAILQDFVGQIEANFADYEKELREHLDFSEIEQHLSRMANQVVASVLEKLLNKILSDEAFLGDLKQLGGRLAMRFKEYRPVTLRLGNGETIKVSAPYFLKATPKRGKKKRGPNGRGGYLGLDVMGFIGRCSPKLVSLVVQMALLCPSIAVSKAVLCEQGIEINTKTIRRLCRELGRKGLSYRGEMSFDGREELKGHTLVIGIDGGRLRERVAKRGRKRKGQKRQGFYAEWREPKLFTLYVQDAEGKIIKEFSPVYDATMGDHTEMFLILKKYVDVLDLSQVDRVVFCGDGSPWIWSGVEKLLLEMGLPSTKVYQVLDYTHAKQNLNEIIGMVPVTRRKKHNVDERWKAMLWNGDIQGIYKEICHLLRGAKKKRALKKWADYFDHNTKRMQYARFKKEGLPCGSGCVESAIRRVINLRLKAPGSFWKKEMAECFLFLRSQLLSGRWNIFMKNVSGLTRKEMGQKLACDSSDSSQEWLEAA
jgi:hypothetical protein